VSIDHVVLIGNPGTGKTVWARQQATRFPIKPAETAADRSYIWHLSGGLPYPGDLTPPFRAPHHTVSEAGMVGQVLNGYRLRPGELILAHGGTLFLDELPEFRRPVLDAVLSAIHNGFVVFHGENHHFSVPARFRLIAAMNPCPCGNRFSSTHECHCTVGQIDRYLDRVEPIRELCRTVSRDEWQLKQ
jgi:magnesium chelatase family protein